MEIYFVLFVLTFLLILLLFQHTNKHVNSKLPSGPKGLPLLGNFLQILKDPHKRLSEWVPKYGNLFTISVGPSTKALIISDPKLMKEIFSLSASTGKFQTETFSLPSRGQYGLVTTEGKVWSEQRQFSIKSLKEFGFGNKKTLEPVIISEAQEVMTWIDKEMEKNGEVEGILKIFKIATNNTLWTMFCGERVNLSNQQVTNYMTELMDAMQITVTSGLNFLPWLKYIAPEWTGYNYLDRISREFHEFVEKIVNDHKKTHVFNSPRDIIDMYIDQLIKAKNDTQSSFYGEIGLKHTISSITSILEAGGETTPYTLVWLLLYVCHHPKVQSKMHQEIDNIIGKDRDPSLLDKQRMPYTEAVILETLRKSSLVPLGLIHQITDTVQYKDYVLPKDLLLIPNMYHISNDPSLWGQDADLFVPERFLSLDGTTVLKKDGLVAFQPGKRQCLGEPLAKDVLFLFTTKLFQSFEVSPAMGYEVPDFDPEVGLGLLPKPFKLLMKKRVSF